MALHPTITIVNLKKMLQVGVYKKWLHFLTELSKYYYEKMWFLSDDLYIFLLNP